MYEYLGNENVEIFFVVYYFSSRNSCKLQEKNVSNKNERITVVEKCMRNAYLSREEGMNHACLVQLMLYTIVYITVVYLFVKFIMKNTKKNLKNI